MSEGEIRVGIVCVSDSANYLQDWIRRIDLGLPSHESSGCSFACRCDQRQHFVMSAYTIFPF
jgi:hypothetical protein